MVIEFKPSIALIKFRAQPNTFQIFQFRLEKNRVNLRLDPNVEPTRNRYATVGEAEIPKLRKIKNVIRKGRISEITADKVS